MNMLLRPVRTSVGSKYLMAITGLGLTLFVIGHLAGNLLIFAPGGAFNGYAAGLKHNPGLLWTARIILIILFLLHLGLAIRLTRANQQARPVRYAYEDTVTATWASRHMLLTGLLLLAFIIYHLAQFTFGLLTQATVWDWSDNQQVTINYLNMNEHYDRDQGIWLRRYFLDKPHSGTPRPPVTAFPRDPQDPLAQWDRQDVRTMVIAGFRTWWVSLSYLVALVFLWLHLWHGIASMFQSLGVSHLKYRGAVRYLGATLSTLLLLGYWSIPVCVWLGLVK